MGGCRKMLHWAVCVYVFTALSMPWDILYWHFCQDPLTAWEELPNCQVHFLCHNDMIQNSLGKFVPHDGQKRGWFWEIWRCELRWIITYLILQCVLWMISSNVRQVYIKFEPKPHYSYWAKMINKVISSLWRKFIACKGWRIGHEVTILFINCHHIQYF